MVLKSINCLLADGTTCKIDIKFYPIFKKYNWYRDNYGYIVTHVKINGKYTILKLHHLVMDFKYDPLIDLEVDHKYGDKSDNRKKKLRIVKKSTNLLNNSGYANNTGFERIHCHHDDDRKSYYYHVSYRNINKLPEDEYFRYIPGKNEEDAFLKAFEFYEYTLTLPHYVEARPNPDDESSSGENVHETNYENSGNLKRLRPDNTSTEKNIYNDKENSRWVVKYHNEKGIRTTKPFYYKPKSNDTKEESFLKAIKFRDEHPIIRKKHNKKPVNINTNINITINNNILKTKKKKKSLPIRKNIEDDNKTSPENDDTDSSNDEFREEYENFNRKNIPEKSKLDKLIEENTPKSLLDILIEKNTPKSKSNFDLLLEKNTCNIIKNGNVSGEDAMTESFDEMDIDTKTLNESYSSEDPIIMSEEEINKWKRTRHPNYDHHFILK